MSIPIVLRRIWQTVKNRTPHIITKKEKAERKARKEARDLYGQVDDITSPVVGFAMDGASNEVQQQLMDLRFLGNPHGIGSSRAFGGIPSHLVCFPTPFPHVLPVQETRLSPKNSATSSDSGTLTNGGLPPPLSPWMQSNSSDDHFPCSRNDCCNMPARGFVSSTGSDREDIDYSQSKGKGRASPSNSGVTLQTSGKTFHRAIPERMQNSQEILNSDQPLPGNAWVQVRLFPFDQVAALSDMEVGK